MVSYHCKQKNPPLAQLDRVSDSDSEGREFESRRAGQKTEDFFEVLCFLSIYSICRKGCFMKREMIIVPYDPLGKSNSKSFGAGYTSFWMERRSRSFISVLQPSKACGETDHRYYDCGSEERARIRFSGKRQFSVLNFFGDRIVNASSHAFLPQAPQPQRTRRCNRIRTRSPGCK